MSSYEISAEQAEKFVQKLYPQLEQCIAKTLEEDFVLKSIDEKSPTRKINIELDWIDEGEMVDGIMVDFEIIRKGTKIIEESVADYMGEKIDDVVRSIAFTRVFGVNDYIFEGGYETGISFDLASRTFSPCYGIYFSYQIIKLPY
jgi:hypothetical protein